ncbi:hypothetical protein FF38_05536, partial [Lucilia cuprina]
GQVGLPLEDEVAEALLAHDELGADERHPPVSESDAHTGEGGCGGHRADNGGEDPRRAGSGRARRLHEQRVDLRDAEAAVDHDRRKRGDEDDERLRRRVRAHPQDRDGNPGEGRDVAQQLEDGRHDRADDGDPREDEPQRHPHDDRDQHTAQPSAERRQDMASERRAGERLHEDLDELPGDRRRRREHPFGNELEDVGRHDPQDHQAHERPGRPDDGTDVESCSAPRSVDDRVGHGGGEVVHDGHLRPPGQDVGVEGARGVEGDVSESAERAQQLGGDDRRPGVSHRDLTAGEQRGHRPGEPAAVDGQDDAVDVGGRVGGEEQRRAGDVLGGPPSARGDPVGDLSRARRVGLELLVELGVDVSGGDGVDVETATRPLVRQRLGQLRDGAFGGHIGGSAEAADERRHRCDVD